MKTIKVAIAGIGNCACSFVQAIYAAKSQKISENSPGLLHPVLAGYRLEDIEIVSAFDVNMNKTGMDLADGIFTAPNCTTKYYDVPKVGVTILKSPILDGISPLLKDMIPTDDSPSVNVAEILKKTQSEILVNLLPVGSSRAVAYFAQAALEAGAAFVNCMPEPIATNPEWNQKFYDAGLPILGDDMKSQIGATTLHRAILDACIRKGGKLIRTYQLNFGGNTDFLNMQETPRKLSKKATKSAAIEARLPKDCNFSVGPSDYVPFMKDHKVAYIRVEGELLLGMPFNIEVRLSVEDSPNAAGIIVDAVRLAKKALDLRLKGAILEVSSFLFKNPPLDMPEEEGFAAIEELCALS
jgi:myo-inositol-1-phosphate synthase